MMYVRNLHAHNCRGLIISWARVGTYGNGHVNCHSPLYVKELFSSLGYRYNEPLSLAFRNGTGIHVPEHPATRERYWWFRRDSTMAFDRIQPLVGPGCS